MTQLSVRMLYWSPRVLSIGLILFLSIFALDVFSEEAGWLTIVKSLGIHLIPSFLLAAALLLAWKRELAGAACFALLGICYSAWVASLPGPIRLSWIVTIAGPAFLISGLFLADWFLRANRKLVQ
jgi:hypothetical protein